MFFLQITFQIPKEPENEGQLIFPQTGQDYYFSRGHNILEGPAIFPGLQSLY